MVVVNETWYSETMTNQHCRKKNDKKSYARNRLDTKKIYRNSFIFIIVKSDCYITCFVVTKEFLRIMHEIDTTFEDAILCSVLTEKYH